MKQLNGHLETRLQEQERRLCLVTTELSKTWHVVGRLRRHHHQLHTHEKILKYELQQKRKLLNELKEELEYCREKWEQAREKNSQSEKDWRKLREEFSNRKLKSTSISINNSAESGYSDERPSDDSSESTDECEYVKEPQVKCKKKLKKSLETGLDSSADLNLAAEREDPASDMLDVADLPLDNQDQEPIDISDFSSSELTNAFESACVLTEDEIGEIIDHSCLDQTVVPEELSENGNPSRDESKNSKDMNKVQAIGINIALKSPSEQMPGGQPLIDHQQILKNIKEQKERISKKDKTMEKLEKEGVSSLNKTQYISKISNEMNNTLNHLINEPTSSKQHAHETNTNLQREEKHSCSTQSSSHTENFKIKDENEMVIIQPEQLQLPENSLISDESSNASSHRNEALAGESNRAVQNTELVLDKLKPSQTSQEPSVDFKSILESIKRQNEHLARKDQKLQNLESGCSSVLNSITNTLSTSNDISNKLDSLHCEYSKRCNDNPQSLPSSSEKSKTESTTEGKPEPSASNDIDHEAIFAARDIRLKRLEEQTKSLVTKVNKTATKGVKINYKLEELHNIYASETSRASTPSEGVEENPQPSTSDDENKK